MAAAQDIKHAPTVAQCQADQRVWMEQVEDQAIVDTISYTTLRQWGLEMKDCQHVDPQFEFRYHNTVVEIIIAQQKRLYDFVVRHGFGAPFS
ncbi:MAG TPA: hypothetical protein VF783_20210 [Terriglobales bacterium]